MFLYDRDPCGQSPVPSRAFSLSPRSGEPPEVLVTNVTPLEGTAFEQRLLVDLRIRNLNDFDLLFAGMDFTLILNGKRLARGLGHTAITIP